MIQRSLLPVLALSLAAVALGTPAAGAAEGKTAADPNKEAKSAAGDKAEKGEQPAKKDPKAMNADEAEAAGLCPVCKNEHKLIYRVTVGEKAYHFATRECKKAFEADPNKFIAGAAGAGGAKKEGAAKKEDDLIDAKDTMKLLGIGENDLLTLVARGDLRAIRTADAMKFRREDVVGLKKKESGVKTEAVEKSAKTEKAEKTEGGEMMGGDMMGE